MKILEKTAKIQTRKSEVSELRIQEVRIVL